RPTATAPTPAMPVVCRNSRRESLRSIRAGSLHPAPAPTRSIPYPCQHGRPWATLVTRARPAPLDRRPDVRDGGRSMSDLLDRVSELMLRLVDLLGYLGLSLVMLIETDIPPIPSELVLPFAGFLVAEGSMNFALVLL